MMRVGSILVPNIETTDDVELKNILRDILDYSKSGLNPSELQTLDFKRELPSDKKSEKDEIRKDFSAFANTEGGLIIVGVHQRNTNDLVIEGADKKSYPKDQTLDEILSARDRITPSLSYSRKTVPYEGNDLVLYQIPEILGGVEVYIGGEWQMYHRVNGITKRMHPLDQTRRAAKPKKLPPNSRVDVSQLNCWSPDYTKRPFLRWKIGDLKKVMKWTESLISPDIPIFVPLSEDVLRSIRLNKYFRRSMERGDNYANMLQLLSEVERQIDHAHGIAYELWTIFERLNNYEAVYRTGGGWIKLKNQLKNMVRKTEVKFGWILLTGSADYILSGKIFEDQRYSLHIEARLGFIPNNFPLVSFENKRVALKPYPVNEMEFESKIKAWRMKEILMKDNPTDSELLEFPSAKIVGYLGQKPLPRDRLFRAGKGATVIEIKDSSKLQDFPPVISEIHPLPSYLSNACSGLDDKNEIKVTFLESHAYSMPFLFSTPDIILLNVDLGANQFEDLRTEESMW